MTMESELNMRGENISPHRLARIAGLLYLALAILGGVAILGLGTRFLVPGDAEATAALILGDQDLYRLGIIFQLASQAIFLFVGLAFFNLFKSVSLVQARMLLFLVVAAVPIAFLNELSKLAPLVLLTDSNLLRVFDPAQLQSLSLASLNLHESGLVIASVFWGLWLIPLGTLTFSSGFFPKVLGVLLWINGVFYLIDSFLGIQFPQFRTAFTPIIQALLAIGEIPFLLWLLIMGAKEKNIIKE